MNSRLWRSLSGLAAVLVVAALILSTCALIAVQRDGRDLAAVRGELTRLGRQMESSRAAVDPELTARFDELTRRLNEISAEQGRDVDVLSRRIDEALPGLGRSSLAPQVSNDDVDALARRMDEAFVQLNGVNAALPGLSDDVHALSERVGEVEAALSGFERAVSAPGEADPVGDVIRSATGEAMQTGSFVVLQSGILIGRESFELYRSPDGFALRSTGTGRRLSGVTTFTAALVADETFRTQAYALRGSTRDGLLDILVGSDAEAVKVSSGTADDMQTKDLPAGSVVILDEDIFALFALLESARQELGGSEGLSVVVPQQGTESAFAITAPETVTLAAPAERLAGERRTVTVGDGWEAVYYVVDGRVVGVEVPGEELFAYRSDRFPSGFLVERRSTEALALPMGVIENELPITSNGVKLDGTLTYPAAGGETLPIVLLLPDLGPYDRNGDRLGLQTGFLKEIARGLAQAGIASYRLDARGTGKSEGTYDDLSLNDLLTDARVAAFVLRGVPHAAQSKIYAFGVGVGGTVASLLASQGTVAGLITFGAPAYAPDTMALDEFARRAAADGISAEETERLVAHERDFYQFLAQMQGTWDDVSYEDVRARLPWMSEEEFARRRESMAPVLVRDLLAVDPTSVVGQVKTRMLILQGDKDFQVSVEQAGRLARAAGDGGNGNVELAILLDVNHVGRLQSGLASSEDRHLRHHIDLQVVGSIADWLSGDIEIQPGGTGSPASAS
ncbi:MAG: alpha/beta hydrolase [Candidatus Bipolaricaulota bacterium]|nr:alpha/beta hydrolase [Candidatus Bipolaricaulota bacterium]